MRRFKSLPIPTNMVEGWRIKLVTIVLRRATGVYSKPLLLAKVHLVPSAPESVAPQITAQNFPNK